MTRTILAFALLGLAGCAVPATPPPPAAPRNLDLAYVDPRQQMIEDRKTEVLRRLAVCESGDHGQSDRPIYGGRGLYLGRFQFIARTVINYVMQMDGRALTMKEATDLAHDYDQAAALAKFIVFELDGIWNWPLCNRKLGLAAEVKAIKAL